MNHPTHLFRLLSVCFVITFFNVSLKAQVCSSCTKTVDQNTTININSNERVCIVNNATVTVQNFNNGELCIAKGSTVNYSNGLNGGTIHNYGTFNFTGNHATLQNQVIIQNHGFIDVSHKLKLNSNQVQFYNYGRLHAANLEIDQSIFENMQGAEVNVDEEMYLHSENIDHNGVFRAGSLRFTNKNNPPHFEADSYTEVYGDARFDAGLTLDGCLIIHKNLTLTSNGRITGFEGRTTVKDGRSTIQFGGYYRGTRMEFYDVNTKSGYESDNGLIKDRVQHGFDQLPQNPNPGDESNFSVPYAEPNCLQIVQPVELLSFKTYTTRKDAILEWVTATETSNDYFEIQQSEDGVNYKPIGRQQGAGTTEEKQEYQFVHLNASEISSTLYYRLKQVDFDGTSDFSDVKMVTFLQEDHPEIKIYPLPAMQGEEVIVEGGNMYKISVLNVKGQLVQSQELSGERIATIPTANISAGMYILLINNNIYKKLAIQ